jgi:hypothetical protein
LSITFTDKGNSSAEIQAAELDANHDSCSEISGCVVGALSSETDPQTGIVTFNNWCAGNGTGVNCNVTPITNNNQLTNGAGYITSYSETDPQVGLLSFNNWCVGNGSGVNCNMTAITALSQLTNDAGFITSYSETDPQVGLVTHSSMCVGNGTGINCNATVPTLVDTDVNNYTSAFSVNTSNNLVTLIIKRNDSNNLSLTFTDKGNSSAEIQAAELDANHDSCSEISGCVVGAITGQPYNYTDFTNVSNLQGLNYTTLNLLFVNITDQRFNETTFVRNVNRTTNIKYLGFNTTAELDTKYIQNSTPGVFNITVQNIEVNGTSSSTVCSGTNKVTQVTMADGVLSSTCATDDTGLPYVNFTTANSTTSSNTIYSPLFVMPLPSSGNAVIQCTMLTWANANTVGIQYNFTITGGSANQYSGEYFSAATTKALLAQSSGNQWLFSPTASQGAVVAPSTFYIYSIRSGAGELRVGHKSETATQTVTAIGSFCHEITR